MRKVLKISLFVFVFLIVGLFFLYFFRNPIVSFSLRKIIASESADKITLSLSNVEFDPLQGSVSIYDPSLIFSDVFLNSNKAMKVEQLSFEKLGIYDVSIRDFLFDRHLVAEKVQVFKPAVHFEVMSTAIPDTNRFSPDKLFDLLNTNSNTLTSLVIRIREVEIRYGSINMQTDTVSVFAPDLLDYTLLLKEFATKSETTALNRNRILYSDEVIFQLRNVYKRLESGYDLRVDSVIYSSKWEHLITNGLRLDPIWENDDSANKSSIAIDQLRLNGLGIPEVRGLEKLHLNALEVSNVRLANYIKGPKVNTQKEINLPRILNDFALDSLNIHHFTFFNIEGESDTTIISKNVELIVDAISFDSTLLENPLQNLNFGHATLSSEYLKLLEVEKGILFTYDGFSYSSKSKQFDIERVNFLTDTLYFNGPQLDLDLASLQINGFSVHDYFQKKKQSIQFKLIKPSVRIDLQQSKVDTTSFALKPNEYLDLLVFQKFKIEAGTVNLTNGEKFNLNLSDLNLETDGLNLIYEDTIKHLIYNSLQFDLDEFDVSFSKGSNQVQAAKITFDEEYFKLSGIQSRFIQKVEGKLANIDCAVENFSVASFDLDTLLFHKHFSTASIDVESLALTGKFPIQQSNEAKIKGNEHSPFSIPLSLHIGEINLEKSMLDITFKQAFDAIQIQTKLDLQVGELNSNEGSFTSWYNPSDWEAHLNDLAINSKEYALKSGSVNLNARNSMLDLNKVSLFGKPNVGPHQNKLGIEKLELPKISVSGLDYKQLLLNDSVCFDKLFIDNPDVALNLYANEKVGDQSATRKKIDFKRLLDVAYDTIDLNGLHLKLANNKDSSHTLITVGNFNFDHIPGKKTADNLMHEIVIQLDELTVKDSINSTSLHLQKLAFDPELLTLTIDNIAWLKKANKQYDPNLSTENNLSIISSKILFSGAYLSETIPSNLHFDKLKFADLDISLVDKKNTGYSQKRELEYDINALRKFTGLLNRFAIDTTVFSDISLHLNTIEGADEHLIKVDSIGLVVNKIDVDTSMLDQKNPVLINNLIIDLKGRTRISKDSLYEIQTGRIHYNFPEHQITVDSFYVLPRFDEAECFRRAKYQKGIINLYARKAEFNDLRIEKLLNDKELHFGSIDVSGVQFNIVKDKKYPIEPGSHKPMPQDMIRNINQKIRVDSLRVFDSYLYFKLYPEKKSNQPGEIFLDKINAKAFNFSNIFDNGQKQSKFKVSLNANIMGESRMNANFYFPLLDTANNWWFSFKTDDIDFTKLNSMTQHLVGLTILRGKGSVDAPLIKGDDFTATGKMIFRYKKIRLSLYNRKKAETDSGIFSSMANFFINDLVIKSNNPKFARKPRVGLVFTERDTQKAIVNFAFKSILSGMLSTLGINQKEQRKERKEYKKEEKQNN